MGRVGGLLEYRLPRRGNAVEDQVLPLVGIQKLVGLWYFSGPTQARTGNREALLRELLVLLYRFPQGLHVCFFGSFTRVVVAPPFHCLADLVPQLGARISGVDRLLNGLVTGVAP